MHKNGVIIYFVLFMMVFVSFNSFSIGNNVQQVLVSARDDFPIIEVEPQSINPRGENEPVVFTNRSPELDIPSITGDSFAWGDYNNDGHLDFITRGNTTIGTRLFKNNGPPNYNFTDVTNQSNISKRGYPVWADYNNDGYLDFFAAGDPDSLWKNNGPPGWNFTDVTLIAGDLDDTRPTEAAAWGDFDRDGFVDLYVNSWYTGTTYYYDMLWHNNGDGTFTDVSSSSGINTVTTPTYRDPPFAGMAVAWGDYNNDGWLDIYVGKYHITPNSLFRNNHDGTFTDVAMVANVTGDPDIYQGAGPYYGHTAGVGWADFDNNGIMDIWSSNLAHKDSEEFGGLGRGYFCDDAQLFYNHGPPSWNFTDIRPSTGIPIIPVGEVVGNQWKDEDYFGITWGDYDNDGDQDMWLPNVKTYHSWDYSYLWRNNLNGTFTDVTPTAGARVWSNTGGAWGDYNNDGFLDLITEGTYPFEGKREIHLFESGKNTNNWLQLRLKGTNSNTAAIGTGVNLSMDDGTFQLREIGGDAGGHGFQNSFLVEYGLGTNTEADSIEIIWPSGAVQILEDIAANQILNVTEPDPAPMITSISVSDNDVDEDDELTFSATFSYSGTISKYEWDFDCDGAYDWSSTTTASTTHSYSLEGVYTAKLRVLDDTNKIGAAESSEFITVNNVEPTANAGEDLAVDEDDDILFNASGTIDTISDLATLRYRWDFDDGIETNWSSNATINYKYPDGGAYYVDLYVQDDNGASSMDQVEVRVFNPEPICNAGTDQLVYEDELVYFNGSGTDTPSDIPFLNFKWDFGDGYDTEWSQSPNASHIYTTQNTYNVTFNAVDDDGDYGEDIIQVIVMSRDPESSVQFSEQTVHEDQTVYLNGSGNDTLSDKHDLSYYWDFGDGDNSGWLVHSVGPNTTHVYTVQGIYTATLIVKDNDDLTTNATSEVTVNNVDPKAIVGEDLTVDEDEVVQLTGSGDDTASDVGTLTYYWVFGNGAGSAIWSSDPNATTNYTVKGEYFATLTVKDNDGATNTTTVKITVENVVPVAKFKADRTTIDEDESVQFDAGGSYDTESDMDTLQYIWRFEDENELEIEHTSNQPLINHTFTRSGNWDVDLKVLDDDDDFDEFSLKIKVDNVDPIAKLTIARTIWKVQEQVTVFANDSWDTPSDRPNLTYQWNFGESSKSTDYSPEPTGTYTYTEAGEFKIKLTVKDDLGTIDTDYVIITVESIETSKGDKEAGLEWVAIPIVVGIIILLTIFLLVFKKRRDKELETELELIQAEEVQPPALHAGVPPGLPPPLIMPGMPLPPPPPPPTDQPFPKTENEMRVEAARVAQGSLERIVEAEKSGIDGTKYLQTLEKTRAAMKAKSYREALALARLSEVETKGLGAVPFALPPLPPPTVAPTPAPTLAQPPIPKYLPPASEPKVIPTPFDKFGGPPALAEEEPKEEAKDEKALKKASKKKKKAEKKRAKKDRKELEEQVEEEPGGQVSERVAALKDELLKPIQESQGAMEARLSRVQDMLKRVQDLEEFLVEESKDAEETVPDETPEPEEEPSPEEEPESDEEPEPTEEIEE